MRSKFPGEQEADPGAAVAIPLGREAPEQAELDAAMDPGTLHHSTLGLKSKLTQCNTLGLARGSAPSSPVRSSGAWPTAAACPAVRSIVSF